MEDTVMTVAVEVTVKEGRFYFNIKANDNMDMEMIRSILAGGLALSIRGEKTPQKQGKVLKEVINYLESEFINTDSFNDIYTKDK
jgi:hypothetical protein